MKNRIDEWIGPGNFWTGLKILLFVAAVGIILVYFAYRMEFDLPAEPCSPAGFPARCYRIKSDACEVIWQKSEGPCRQYVLKLSLPLGRLVGPFIFKCQSAGLDRAFQYSRKSSPECDRLFDELEDWKRTNDIKSE